MKRFISWLLAVALLLTMAMPVAAAEDERTSGAFTYQIKGNGTLAITGYDWENNNGNTIYIPQMLDGYTVTEISPFAFEAQNKERAGGVIIPQTITSIGSGAFTGITFDTKVINIPSSVKYIGVGAFLYITGIESFSVDSGNSTYATIDGVLYKKDEKMLLAYPPAKEADLFVIPDGIESIAAAAFSRIKSIDTIRFPDTLEIIGDYAFENSSIHTHASDVGIYGQTWLVLPQSITHIGVGAFYGYSSWNGIDLSLTKIKEISPYAFWGWGSGSMRPDNTFLKLPDTLERIGEYAFAESMNFFKPRSLPSCTIPTSVTEIGEGAFANSYLSQLTIPSGSKLQIIGKNAFQNSKLSQINFPSDSKLQTIEEGAFQNSSLSQIVLPDGIERIGASAFADCTDIKNLSLPASVKELGDNICDRNRVYLETVPGSYAALYASENGYMVKSIEEDTSWLND